MRIGSAAIQLVETTTLSQSNRCWWARRGSPVFSLGEKLKTRLLAPLKSQLNSNEVENLKTTVHLRELGGGSVFCGSNITSLSISSFVRLSSFGIIIYIPKTLLLLA